MDLFERRRPPGFGGHRPATKVNAQTDPGLIHNFYGAPNMLLAAVDMLMEIENSMSRAPFIAGPRRRRLGIGRQD